jgi:hypothetical protein
MHAGALAAWGEVFWFLHADTLARLYAPVRGVRQK